MARPRVFSGNVVGVKLPSLLELRIRSEADRCGQSISQVIRDALRKQFGNYAENDNKD